MSETLKPGVVTGEDYKTLVSAAKAEQYALPAVNVVGTNSINSAMEAAAKNKSDIIIQFSNSGGQFFAGFGLEDSFEAKVLGTVSAAQHVHLLAEKYGISTIVIGLTVVAFGTSLPELLVSLNAAFQGSSSLAIGNAIGSNIANVGLILGLTALLYKMEAIRLTYRKDWLFLLGANVLLGGFLLSGGINFLQGMMLVATLLVYNVLKIRSARTVSYTHLTLPTILLV